MSTEPIKRIVLSRFWVGDRVYHVTDSSRGLVVSVQFEALALKVKYFCVFADRKGEWCEEMELSDERVFSEESEDQKAKT